MTPGGGSAANGTNIPLCVSMVFPAIGTCLLMNGYICSSAYSFILIIPSVILFSSEVQKRLQKRNSFIIMGLFFLVSCGDNNSETGNKPVINLRTDSPLIKKELPNPYVSFDLSPMDLSYFPADYPILKMTGKVNTPPNARIIYSRPHRQGRQIFGSLLKYGEPWRLGANEATELEFFQPAIIQGKTVAKGRYTLYCIPEENQWTVAFNSNLFSWGLQPDTTKDVHRFTIPVERSDTLVEFYTMVFKKTETGAELLMAWEDVVARLPMEFK